MDVLRTIRQKKGDSQYKLAEYLGVSQATVYRYEKGLRAPDDASTWQGIYNYTEGQYSPNIHYGINGSDRPPA